MIIGRSSNGAPNLTIRFLATSMHVGQSLSKSLKEEVTFIDAVQIEAL